MPLSRKFSAALRFSVNPKGMNTIKSKKIMAFLINAPPLNFLNS
jgi:hypothetical protein